MCSRDHTVSLRATAQEGHVRANTGGGAIFLFATWGHGACEDQRPETRSRPEAHRTRFGLHAVCEEDAGIWFGLEQRSNTRTTSGHLQTRHNRILRSTAAHGRGSPPPQQIRPQPERQRLKILFSGRCSGTTDTWCSPCPHEGYTGSVPIPPRRLSPPRSLPFGPEFPHLLPSLQIAPLSTPHCFLGGG